MPLLHDLAISKDIETIPRAYLLGYGYGADLSLRSSINRLHSHQKLLDDKTNKPCRLPCNQDFITDLDFNTHFGKYVKATLVEILLRLGDIDLLFVVRSAIA